ncbi:two component, sigma54 specific, transcriptional regulator, Fis family [Caldithrix abyssi DSM 13497]|uniref:Two component, sigma54 specific, transcriptional regulator, Fis family n=1 Tax=Caldithrix abyssi DSM 13497 TaxID=880073 RepID=H1XU53_CALAY|nr:sigma-54 dependent transcriptional regulator [Caldithrix abyssi]APF17442.1 two-component system, NtrC family, response regulator [Caldithrix abyssi DSM 13497]EHO41543.1 two component, sigma54 specific, transcriptional regulator, Fis family [Caldithrix abyssi DSM 13497]
MKQFSILVVDDEKIQRESLAGFLAKKRYQVYKAGNFDAALQIIKQNAIDLVLTDVKMSGKSGYDLLKAVKEINPSITVIIMTAYGNIEEAVAAMKDGAYDYLTKPLELDEVELLINRAFQFKQLTEENAELRQKLSDKHRFTNIISASPLMEEALNMAARSAKSRASVLIEGESGTGKELIARAIHFASPRKDKPLVVINCAAISESLLESELFGHEKGAFTGAIQARAGRVEEADGGTLFLDEVGDIPLSVQVKLLRFLQFGEFQRVGSNQSRKVDVRLISATNRDLLKMIQEGAFREDFYYRLNVINIKVPPLRKRKEDIPMLIDHFIKKYAAENGKEIKGISREAMDLLMKYDYPGNVRELENLIERAVVLSRSEIIEADDLPIQMRVVGKKEQAPPVEYYPGDFRQKVEAFEKDLILKALEEADFNQSQAARALGLSERNLRYKMAKYGIERAER